MIFFFSLDLYKGKGLISHCILLMVSPELFAVDLSLLYLPLVSPLGSSPPLCQTFLCRHCCLYQSMSFHHPLHLPPGPVTIATRSVIQERNHHTILSPICV